MRGEDGRDYYITGKDGGYARNRLICTHQGFSDELGYTVQAEVNGCDIVAQQGEQLLIIEMKLNFTTALLMQAADRQRWCDDVYVALPRPTSREWRQSWPGRLHLLRRLELLDLSRLQRQSAECRGGI